MALVKPKLPYRIGVEFVPPLSTLSQLRDVCVKLNTRSTVPVALSTTGASLIAVFPNERDLGRIDYGQSWFVVGPLGKRSRAIIRTIRPEVNFTR